MDLDATSLYLPAMWDRKLIYPVIETRYVFKSILNDELVKNFKTQQPLTQGSAVSKILF